MKTPIALALLAIVALATPAAAERACRPSLSNAYHCPDTPAAAPAKKSTQTTRTSGRECQPSLSNLWTCPGTAAPRPKTASTDRASTDRTCRPSLSNGYYCPGKTTDGRGSPTSTPDRDCRPSLSNGYSCPGPGQAKANQYSSEILARATCPTETVVWANTRSSIYHFRGTSDYGTTKVGFYMCEQSALAGGIRAAKDEKHP
jgi:hypothetical protein